MSELWRVDEVIALLDGDAALLEEAYAAGICERRAQGLLPAEVEAARVARVLVRELDVNWPGVEIILRLRQEIIGTHRQVADLLELVRRARAGAGGD